MLEAVELACVRGDRLLFKQLSFRVAPGQVLWVTGQNGAGKTSLLRMLCGLAPPAAGAVRWKGSTLESVLYLGHANALKDDLTPVENLAYLLPQVGRERIRGQLELGGLKHCADLPVRVLSQGQRRRVALARLPLSRDTALWVLDEPLAALDAQAIAGVNREVAAHASAGGTVVLTSHQEVTLGDVPASRLSLGEDSTHP